VLGLFLLAFVIFLIFNGDKNVKVVKSNNQSRRILELSQSINGKLVESKIAEKRPLAVMVENHPDARPQSGLSDAGIVYEALTEGGITRFLALFQSDSENIGPVRSARDYFASIADEWGAVYAHVGGSNEVIEQLKEGKYQNLDDVNEYYNENSFRRNQNRKPPHNVYTSTEKLRELIKYRQFKNISNFKSFKFKEDEPVLNGVAPAGKINIDFSLDSYKVGYEYSLDGNDYSRFLAGKPHIDLKTQKQIKVKNIVAQFVEVTPWPNDPLLRVDINLKGEGRAVIFLDGKVIEGWWRKEADGKTRYYNLQDRKIKFNRGSIWIELVPEDKQEEFKWEEVSINAK